MFEEKDDKKRMGTKVREEEKEEKLKPKVLGEIDAKGKESGVCNTFVDDIVGAIAAATASRIAHSYGRD